MSLLRVDRLAVAYGPIRALHDVSIRVEEGELVSIIGPNGAGKSTLMRTLSGLMAPQRGEISLAGQDLIRLPSHKRFALGLVQVAEGRAILQRLTVHENLQLAFEHGRETRPPSAVFAEIYDRFALLAERRALLAGTLSGGEQQMLAIARALVAHPRLLLLDEPSLGLAPLMVKQVFRVISELRGAGTSILLVEQNVREALRVADRGYVLELGRIAAEGAGHEIISRPEVMRAYLGATESISTNSSKR
jgi:branched-chain amino acid transport system ATP-binding protein